MSFDAPQQKQKQAAGDRRRRRAERKGEEEEEWEERGRGKDRSGGNGGRGGRRVASEGHDGGEDCRRLRWRVNDVENEKLQLKASHNQEVSYSQS